MVYCNDSRHTEVRNENHKNWQRLGASRPRGGLDQDLRPPKDGFRILLFVQTQPGGKVGPKSENIAPNEAEIMYAARTLGMDTLGSEMLASFRLLYYCDTATTEEARKLQLIPESGKDVTWDPLMEWMESPERRKLPTASHTSKALARKLTTHAGASWKSGGTAKYCGPPFIILANPLS
jgi:hypothetical protein